MRHETKNHHSSAGRAARSKTGRSVQTARPIHERNQTTARGQRSGPPQIQARTAADATAALLNQTIPPVWFGPGNPGAICQRFTGSARRVCRYLGLPDYHPSPAPFPEGIVEDYDRIALQMKEQACCYRLFISDSPDQLGTLGIVTAAVLEPVFLPMATLGRMVLEKPDHPAIPVIALLFSYLIDVAGLQDPFVNDEVSRIYQDIGQSAGDCGDEEDDQVDGTTYCEMVWNELAEGEEYSLAALNYIGDQVDLSQWDQCVTAYAATHTPSKKLIRAARRLRKLYRQFPNGNMHDGVYPDLAEVASEEDPLSIERCLGFCYGNGDRVHDDFECWIAHPGWDEENFYLPLGYIIFPSKGKPIKGCSTFTERLYYCCAALADAIHPFKM